MTPLRQRMIDAMVLRGFSPRTQESYADAIYGMAKHYRRDPAQYSALEVEAYLLHLSMDVSLCPCCKVGRLHVTAVLLGQARLPAPTCAAAQQSRGPP